LKKIRLYQTESGKVPFSGWFEKLDGKTKARVQIYTERLAQGGTKKNIKPLGEGVFEAKLKFGPGLRLYFGEDGNELIVLLLGGDKGTQDQDIKKAKMYWRDYAKTNR